MRYILTVIFIILSPVLLARNTTQASDSLLHLLKSVHSPEKRIQIYRNLADIYLGDPEAKTYLLKMYQEASKINDKRNMLDALNDITIEAANIHCKDSVIKYINYIKKVASPEEIKSLLPLYHIRIFNAQYLSKEKEKALKEELDLVDSKKDSDNVYKNIASTYAIGAGYYVNQQYQQSVSYLDKAMKLTESLPEKDKYEYQRAILDRLCFAYAQAGKEKESVSMMEHLINLVELKYRTDYQKQRPFYRIELYQLQHYSFMISCLKYLTLKQENYYWQRTQEISKNLTNDIDRYNYYLCANNYYSNNHTKIDLTKAIEANDSLIKIAKTLAPQNLSGLYDINSQLYKEAKDYRNALRYLEISHHIQDSIDSDNTQKQLHELQVKYDINTLNSEKAQLEIKNKKILVIFLSILLITVIGICTYLYFSLKKEKRMKAEMKRLHNKAQESEKMKQAFINSICHEIRTPLNSIVGFSDLIMNPDIDEEMRRDFPAEIQKNTMLLTSLVNSMLEVASLDVSEETLPCEPVDLKAICIQEMEKLHRKPKIQYKLEISEETMLIPSNAQYLTQVIEHLLNNANKFTERGKITLGYKINYSKDKIQINVTDTGCGIPEEKREEVFKRFSKLNTFVPGNGLGLYLCRLIVKRLSGEIKIDPDYTEGTRMIVSLPINCNKKSK